MDELVRLNSLLEMYESVLAELRAAHDPALDELITRLECREAQAAYEHSELLHPLGARDAVGSLPRRIQR